jgi:hypothetical protein
MRLVLKANLCLIQMSEGKSKSATDEAEHE